MSALTLKHTHTHTNTHKHNKRGSWEPQPRHEQVRTHHEDQTAFDNEHERYGGKG
jgi:hypothetical protein